MNSSSVNQSVYTELATPSIVIAEVVADAAWRTEFLMSFFKRLDRDVSAEFTLVLENEYQKLRQRETKNQAQNPGLMLELAECAFQRSGISIETKGCGVETRQQLKIAASYVEKVKRSHPGTAFATMADFLLAAIYTMHHRTYEHPCENKVLYADLAANLLLKVDIEEFTEDQLSSFNFWLETIYQYFIKHKKYVEALDIIKKIKSTLQTSDDLYWMSFCYQEIAINKVKNSHWKDAIAMSHRAILALLVVILRDLGDYKISTVDKNYTYLEVFIDTIKGVPQNQAYANSFLSVCMAALDLHNKATALSSKLTREILSRRDRIKSALLQLEAEIKRIVYPAEGRSVKINDTALAPVKSPASAPPQYDPTQNVRSQSVTPKANHIDMQAYLDFKFMDRLLVLDEKVRRAEEEYDSLNKHSVLDQSAHAFRETEIIRLGKYLHDLGRRTENITQMHKADYTSEKGKEIHVKLCKTESGMKKVFKSLTAHREYLDKISAITFKKKENELERRKKREEAKQSFISVTRSQSNTPPSEDEIKQESPVSSTPTSQIDETEASTTAQLLMKFIQDAPLDTPPDTPQNFVMSVPPRPHSVPLMLDHADFNITQIKVGYLNPSAKEFIPHTFVSSQIIQLPTVVDDVSLEQDFEKLCQYLGM